MSTITITYRDAIVRALRDAMAEDDDVFVLGEDVAHAGGAFKLTDGLLERFGEQRVLDTPISEQAIVGAAIGAAVMGLRPVAEIMFADFTGVCFDQIANELAKYRYMTGGQVTVPVTIRCGNGAGAGFAAQHSQPCENWFLNIPGLKIAVPGTAADAYGLLRSAIRDPNPVLVFEHKNLFGHKEDLTADLAPVPLGQADVVRLGEHATLVATQMMRRRALEAAELLEAEDISLEVIDPRTLVPLDLELLSDSIKRTNHLLVVQEASHFGSWGATLVSELMQSCFESLDAPPMVIGGDETPIPYANVLEQTWLPAVERIADGVRRTLAY
jgi:pyruvate/2-oxoglutarate/acetoin dehydrogenase E1 component